MSDGPYPLVFRVQIPVQGRGFSGRVEFRGGAVVTVEDGGYLAHGLRPGGVAGVGSTLVESCLDLKEQMELVLYDLTEEAVDFLHFRKLVAEFFNDEDEWARSTWERARKLVATGTVSADLPRRNSPALRHSVRVFEESEPANNPRPAALGLASLRKAA